MPLSKESKTMMFMASETENFEICNGTRLEFAGPDALCRVGAGYRVVIDKDHSLPMSIEAMGRLRTGDGKTLDDVVADITVGDQRFGMIRFGTGQLGPQWRVNGPPYSETFAPLSD
jgi:hypothetical protein